MKFLTISVVENGYIVRDQPDPSLYGLSWVSTSPKDLGRLIEELVTKDTKQDEKENKNA